MTAGGGGGYRRRAPALALLLLVALLPPPASGAPPVYTAHGPVFIGSDADFTAANGVVSGTGTPADPYVISGWRFATTFGTALIVRNTTAAFTVRGNLFEAFSGVSISAATSQAVVENNLFHVQSTGAAVTEAQVTFANNSFLKAGTASYGIQLAATNSIVVNNSFSGIQHPVFATGAGPLVQGNDIHLSTTAITFRSTVDACATGNVITIATTGVLVDNTIRACVRGNSITSGAAGIVVLNSKDVDVWSNGVRGEDRVGIEVRQTSGNVTSNTVIDGQLDGIVVDRSPVLVNGNVVSNNLGTGIGFTLSDATASGNVLARNGLGIRLRDSGVVHLVGNTLTNNTVGMDVPYVARQSITWMAGNVVNGVNVDGTLVPAQKVFFYKAANILISGQLRDSGFSAGYFGSLTAQGGVVLYEVDTARIEATTLSHHNIGVGSVNSFNVVVESSAVSNTIVGVRAQCVAVAFQVPACVVAVKNSTINVTIDPIGTLGIDVQGGFANVIGNDISVVDTGVRFGAAAYGNVSENAVHGTFLALDLSGLADRLDVRHNVVTGNRIGARLTGFVGIVANNTFSGNVISGVELRSYARVAFTGNTVADNGQGVVENACGMVACALEASDNVIAANRGDGVRVNGTSRFEGDVFSGNRGTGARLQSATLVDVVAAANGEDGASVVGTFTVRGSTMTGNARHGLQLRGIGDLRGSNFTYNGEAGIRATATYVHAFNINASYNLLDGIQFDELLPTVTVPTVTVPDLLSRPLQPPQNADPMDIHRSSIVGNQRDGVRAGAAIVNATHNYWGGGRPAVSVADQVGAFQNGVSASVRFLPFYRDAAMTTTGPVAGL